MIPLSALLLMLVATLCHAQDSAAVAPPEAEVDALLLVAMTPGISLPLGENRPHPGDPIHLFDSAMTRVAFAATVSYRILPALAVECTIDFPAGEPMEMVQEVQLDRVRENHPDYLIESQPRVAQPTMMFSSLGISYRLQLGPISLEPSLLASYAGTSPAELQIMLKEKGANEYHSITYRTTGGGAFTVVPAITGRYMFKLGDRYWGAQLRAAYLSTSFDTPFTLADESLTSPPRTSSFTTHHTFRAVHIGLGLAFPLLCTCN